jgi:hypothetical protein
LAPKKYIVKSRSNYSYSECIEHKKLFGIDYDTLDSLSLPSCAYFMNSLSTKELERERVKMGERCLCAIDRTLTFPNGATMIAVLCSNKSESARVIGSRLWSDRCGFEMSWAAGLFFDHCR